jgi:hypothetical protein
MPLCKIFKIKFEKLESFAPRLVTLFISTFRKLIQNKNCKFLFGPPVTFEAVVITESMKTIKIPYATLESTIQK